MARGIDPTIKNNRNIRMYTSIVMGINPCIKNNTNIRM